MKTKLSNVDKIILTIGHDDMTIKMLGDSICNKFPGFNRTWICSLISSNIEYFNSRGEYKTRIVSLSTKGINKLGSINSVKVVNIVKSPLENPINPVVTPIEFVVTPVEEPLIHPIEEPKVEVVIPVVENTIPIETPVTIVPSNKSIYLSDSYVTHMNDLHIKLYDYQKKSLDHMKLVNKCTIHQPTGTGKSLIIYSDMLENFKNDGNDIFVIATHRLMLNSQHLTNMFNEFKCLVGSIGYIFVGSYKYDFDELGKNEEGKEFNNLLKEQNLNYKDIFISTTTKDEIKKAIETHRSLNRDIVIVTTYHSLDRLEGLDINTIYCDEAHLLATERDLSEFKTNFNSIQSSRTFFFTATPKDAYDEETEAFLMNNKDVFGEKIGLKFGEAVKLGCIVKPVIHLATPTNYDAEKSFESIDNYCKFIKEVYKSHKNWLFVNSFDNKLIAPKLLVKCPSVDDMWGIHESLINDTDFSNVKIFAGASRNDDGSKHYINNESINSRDEFLSSMKKLTGTEESIFLHYDILSEGIDVPGITGVFFLIDTLPTVPKILQNIGRATRLNVIDREKLRSNLISVDDYSKWIKPYCAIILPIIKINSEYVVSDISRKIREMRDFGIDPKYIVSEGNDIPVGKKPEDLDMLNNPNKRTRFDLIERISHEIEKIDSDNDVSKFTNKIINLTTDEEKTDLLLKELGIE